MTMQYPMIPGMPPAGSPFPAPQPPAQPPAQAPAYAPPVAPTYQQGFTAPPAGYAPPPGAVPGYAPPNPMAPISTADLGAAVAAATMGVERLLDLLPGDYLLQIDQTSCPDQKKAFVPEFTVITSTNPERPAGCRARWYQALEGGSKQGTRDAQTGAVLQFVVRAMGFQTKADLLAAFTAQTGGDPQAGFAAFTAALGACFVKPGPLAGRQIRASVVSTGKMTRPNDKGMSYPINNHYWNPA